MRLIAFAKIIFPAFIAIFLCTASSISAQENQYSIGIKGGTNHTNYSESFPDFSGNSESFISNNEWRTGYKAGIKGKYRINNIFHLTSALLYDQHESLMTYNYREYYDGDGILPDIILNMHDRQTLTYISIPIAIELYPTSQLFNALSNPHSLDKNEVQDLFHIEVGVYNSILLSYQSSVAFYDIYRQDLPHPESRNYVLGILGGMGLNVPFKGTDKATMNINARYIKGVSSSVGSFNQRALSFTIEVMYDFSGKN